MSSTSSSSVARVRRRLAPLSFALRVTPGAFALLAASLILLPLYGSLTVGGRVAAQLAIAGLFVITLVRPEDGLLLCAAFLPLGALFGRFLGFPLSMRAPLVLAFLAAWLIRQAIVGRHPPADSDARGLLLPASLFAAVVAASILVQLMIEQVYEAFPLAFAGRVLAQLVGQYIRADTYPALVAGGRLLEAIGLFAATVVLCRQRPTLARRTLAMAAVTATGIAALNLSRMAAIWLSDPAVPWTLAFSPRNLRVDLLLSGPNSGGSYFVMMLFVACGLLMTARRAAWTWSIPTLTILAALWLTGSRAAWAGAVLSGALLLMRKMSWSRRMSALAIFGLTAVLLAATILAMAVIRTRQWTDQPVEVATRTELGLAALRMTASQPVFGVGVGRFFAESAAYIDPGFAARYYARENAHNNFLQILAELGSAGFVAFIWLLTSAGRRIAAAWQRGGDPVFVGAGCGLVAFLCSCLAGHPLLIPEVSLAFWLVLGAAAAPMPGHGVGDERDPEHRTAPGSRRAWRAVLVPVAVGCLAVSVPVRAWSFIANEADLGSATIGFSDPRTGDDGLTYRMVQGRAQFFVRGTTCSVRMWVRLDPGGSERSADVEVRASGQVANRFPAVADSWRELKLMLHRDGARFRAIELRTPQGPDVRVLTTEPSFADCKQ